MALIKSLRGYTPYWGDNCFFAENATVIGDVQMGNHCTVWFNAVIRGDVNSIRFGDYCNVQDGAVIHCTYQKTKTIVGNRVSIAHNAIVHGCTIEDDVLIGMGAIVMDGAHIKSGAIIAAGAIVLANSVVDENTIWGGNPAKFIKYTGEKVSEIQRIANNYPKYAAWFQEESSEK